MSNHILLRNKLFDINCDDIIDNTKPYSSYNILKELKDKVAQSLFYKNVNS